MSQTSGLGVHSISTTVASILVLDKAQSKRTATILVTRELLNGGVGVIGVIESYYTSTTGASVWLVLDLSLLNLTNSREQLDKILIAGRPGKLISVSPIARCQRVTNITHIADIDSLASFCPRCSEVGEWVWRSGWNSSIETAMRWSLETTAKTATSTAKSSTKSTSSTKAATGTKASTKSTSGSESTAATKPP